MAWSDSSWNPSNWFSNAGSPSMQGADFSAMADAGYQVPTSAQMNDSSNFNLSADGSSGGMNWAGLSKGLGDLSKALGTSAASDSTAMQGSKSVASTGVSGGTLQPQSAGSGASALGSVLANRNQLEQYLMLAAMQGKGRGKSGQGLLG